MSTLTQAHLWELLTYDPSTGEFRWRIDQGRGRAGNIAGTIDHAGYRVIEIDGKKFKGHRLAVFYITGKWPARGLDHKNLAKSDNRWDNSRSATKKQNSANIRARRDNKLGIKRVTKTRSGRYQAHIQINGTQTHLGTFDTAEEASYAYAEAATAAFGEYARI